VIPLASPLAQYRAHRKLIQNAITHVLESGRYILGEEVQSFERDFAEYCGIPHAIGVASGTDALILALRAIGVGPGDEVITVSHTALATVAAVLACSAIPVLVDVDPSYYTIDPVCIEAAITRQSKAIIAVHLYGQAVDIDPIAAIARRRQLHLVEDCAQAVGADYLNRKVGSLGDIGCFSFYPTKNLGGIGDGGMVTTASAELASRVYRLRQYGWDDYRNTCEVGLNSRLDALQAAILHAKLPGLDVDNARRVAIARRYTKSLTGLPLVLPTALAANTHVYHLYVVKCDERDRLGAHLAADQISSAVHYPVPVHRQRGYADKVVVPKGGLPVTSELANRVLSLPIFPELSDLEVDCVVASVRQYYQRH
jgi:dTDP-4-amino-4,6-dideoxygalactose transaminase